VPPPIDGEYRRDPGPAPPARINCPRAGGEATSQLIGLSPATRNRALKFVLSARSACSAGLMTAAIPISPAKISASGKSHTTQAGLCGI